MADCHAAVAEFMELLGSPWAGGKSQAPGPKGDLLGLVHDFSDVAEGVIRFLPREALIDKVEGMIRIAEESGLHSGNAAKLYGVLNFLETGLFGRVGQGACGVYLARRDPAAGARVRIREVPIRDEP